MAQIRFYTDEDIYGAVAVALHEAGLDAVRNGLELELPTRGGGHNRLAGGGLRVGPERVFGPGLGAIRFQADRGDHERACHWADAPMIHHDAGAKRAAARLALMTSRRTSCVDIAHGGRGGGFHHQDVAREIAVEL